VGEWSRYDVMTKPAEFARAAIPGLSATLPPTAHSLYYRDAIGNISSSGGSRYSAVQCAAVLCICMVQEHPLPCRAMRCDCVPWSCLELR
jgi:hypothetical protein